MIINPFGTGGTNTSDATATAADIRQGKTAYVNGEKVTGSIPSQAGRTIRPTTYQQTAVESGKYTTGGIYVEGDANLIPENIAYGKSLFGVSGNYRGSVVTPGTGSVSTSNRKRITLPAANNSTPTYIALTFTGYSVKTYQAFSGYMVTDILYTGGTLYITCVSYSDGAEKLYKITKSSGFNVSVSGGTVTLDLPSNLTTDDIKPTLSVSGSSGSSTPIDLFFDASGPGEYKYIVVQ